MKKLIKKVLSKLYKNRQNQLLPNNVINEFPDFSNFHNSVYEDVKDYTMVSPERIYSIIENVKYICDNNLEGSIVECGVWKGGCIAAVIKSLIYKNDFNRDIYLYDTFETMSEPTEFDIDYTGLTPLEVFKRNFDNEKISDWKAPSLSEVKNYIYSLGYPQNKIFFIKGKVEDTIPDNLPKQIAILRLDTDWYKSTMHELNYLYPQVINKGVVIIDDYGHWKGAKKAVDDYFVNLEFKPLLNRVDYTCRNFVKYE